MNGDSTVVLAIVTFALAQLGLFLDQRRRARSTDDKIDVVSANADTASQAAELAAKRAEPVSDDFAGSVLGSLDHIKSGQDDLKTELGEVRKKLDDHIGDHASAHVLRRGK